MIQYLKLLSEIKDKGCKKESSRENMPGTNSLFGYQFRHNLWDGFPLLTTKKLSFKNIVVELLWFLKGNTNIKYLVDNGCNIWNQDAYNYYLKVMKNTKQIDRLTFEEFVDIIGKSYKEELCIYFTYDEINYTLGDCGYQYGKLWRDFNGVDQIKNLIEGLKKNPLSRRHILTAWKPESLNDMALNACHTLVQFNCREVEDGDAPAYDEVFSGRKYYLDCQLYQRSGDAFLGVPYNIASYSLLIHIIAELLDMIPGDFIHTFGDVHIYDNHIESVNKQLIRKPSLLPVLDFNSDFYVLKEKYIDEEAFSIDEFINFLKPEMFVVKGYKPQPAIKGELSTGLIL